MRALLLCFAAGLVSAATATADPGRFYVHGDVGSPGRFPAVAGTNAREAIAQAGGFLASADRAKVRIVRDKKIINVDASRMADYVMHPDDRLIVVRQSAR